MMVLGLTLNALIMSAVVVAEDEDVADLLDDFDREKNGLSRSFPDLESKKPVNSIPITS